MSRNILVAACVALSIASGANAGGLVGTDLSLSALQQASSTSPVFVSSFPRVARVSATTVEFPDVSSLFNPNDPRPPGFGSLVNTWIDAGNDYIEIDFDNIQSAGFFASGFQNTYVFTFDSIVAAEIVGASIDSLTSLALVDSDVWFSGNQLFVNVESLPFDRDSFVRIDLSVIGGPGDSNVVPGPSGVLLVSTALVAGFGIRQHRRVRKSSTAPARS